MTYLSCSSFSKVLMASFCMELLLPLLLKLLLNLILLAFSSRHCRTTFFHLVSTVPWLIESCCNFEDFYDLISLNHDPALSKYFWKSSTLFVNYSTPSFRLYELYFSEGKIITMKLLTQSKKHFFSKNVNTK